MVIFTVKGCFGVDRAMSAWQSCVTACREFNILRGLKNAEILFAGMCILCWECTLRAQHKQKMKIMKWQHLIS